MPGNRASAERARTLDARTSGVLASLAAEVVFVGMAAIMAGVRTGDPWTPVRLPGAFVLGPDAVEPSGFIAGDVILGSAMHLWLGVLVGLIYVALLPRLGASPIVGGLLAGAILYLLGFWILPQTFPTWLAPFWLPPAPRALNGLAHMVYGIVFGWAYVRLARGRSAEPDGGRPR